MFGSEALEVGIGMALLFLFMSLIATALREAIENLLKGRARTLEKGIKELLNTPGHNATYVQDLYAHPLIASLYKGDYQPGSRSLPSYIPRHNFSLALLDIVGKASQTGSPLSAAKLRESLANVPTPNAVQRVVLNALDTTSDDLTAVRKNLEDWFDGSMDRVAGWYTRQTGQILFAVGLLAAIFFNVDAITVAQGLIRDPSLRQTIIRQAEHTIAQNGPTQGVRGETNRQDIAEVRDDFNKIGFPIGWTVQHGWPYPLPQACTLTPRTATTGAAYLCAYKPEVGLSVFGWLITALAIMLGAPFWFDVLNKLMVVRSTVKPKEKSPDEASADRRGTGARVEAAAATPAPGKT